MNSYTIKRFTKVNNSLNLHPNSKKYIINCKDRITDENPTTDGWINIIKTLKIKNEDDKSRVFLSLLNKHENIVVKIGDSDKIECEYIISKALSDIDGFVNFYCFFTCQGDYLTVDSTLCNGTGDKMKVIVMPYYELGNITSYAWTNINQLRSVLKQTVLNIMNANNKVGFIHNDLHPGNIVLEASDNDVLIYDIQDLGFYVIPTHGIKSIIMDYEESDIEKYASLIEAKYIQQIDGDFEKLFTNLKGYINIDVLTIAPIIIYINTHLMKMRRLNRFDIEEILVLIDAVKFQ